jgi:hypothetical protein
MRDDLIIQRLREAIRKRAKLPPEVQFRQMVERGVIDEKGNVLLRMPMPPRKKAKRKGKGQTGNGQGD